MVIVESAFIGPRVTGLLSNSFTSSSVSEIFSTGRISSLSGLELQDTNSIEIISRTNTIFFIKTLKYAF